MQKQTAKNRLRELRDRDGLKLYEVAAVVKADTTTVHRWETGRTRTIPDDAKVALASLYDVPVTYLMGWDEAGVAA